MNTYALVLLVVSVATFASGSDVVKTNTYKYSVNEGDVHAKGTLTITITEHHNFLGMGVGADLFGKLFLKVISPGHKKIVERTYTSHVPQPGNAQQIGAAVNTMWATGRDVALRAAKNVKLAANKTKAITLTTAAAPAAPPAAAPATPPAAVPAAPPAAATAAPPAAAPAAAPTPAQAAAPAAATAAAPAAAPPASPPAAPTAAPPAKTA